MLYEDCTNLIERLFWLEEIYKVKLYSQVIFLKKEEENIKA